MAVQVFLNTPRRCHFSQSNRISQPNVAAQWLRWTDNQAKPPVLMEDRVHENFGE
jgi:hypothetical protein